MDSKELIVTLTVKIAWWLRPFAYPTFLFMKLFNFEQKKIDSTVNSIFRRAIKYRIGNQNWKRVYGAQ